MEKKSNTCLELEKIVKEIEANAGFEVFLWACGRHDLNDFQGNGFNTNNKSDSYVKAVHNIRTPHQGFYPNFHPADLAMVEQSNEDSNSHYVAYGEYKIDREVAHKIKTKRKGILGLLGFQKTEEVKEVIEENMPLTKCIETGSKNNSYFITFALKADVKDVFGRKSRSALTVVGEKGLVEEIASYLQRNPEQYNDMVKHILPAERFPNVNKGILAHLKPAGSIAFLDVDKIGGYYNASQLPCTEGLYKKYGISVKIK